MSSGELLEKYGFEQEEAEERVGVYVKNPFPKPLKRFRIVWETYNMSVEGPYFWLYNYLQQDWSYLNADKTEDTFAAAENSAFFGVSQQRIGVQQEKVSQYLATIGKMVKDLFQLVRELRIIDERLDYYHDSWGLDRNGRPIEGFNPKKKESAEITLKGTWIDMVQGGGKNPSSVYGLAREVGFTSLPDLFFSTHPTNKDEVDEYVDTYRAGFNKMVKNALKRQLKMFMVWKERTYKELNTRRKFTLQYLRQHYDIIRMYMQWIKPYLRHIRRLTLDEDKTFTPELVSAFEGSMVDVEVLYHKPGKGDFQACILATFNYRTRPSMSYQQEGYQRGPVHVGKMEMTLRAYAWTKEEIEKYKKMKEEEDFEIMKSISDSVKAAMDALGDELKKYLEESGEEIEEKGEEEKEAPRKYGFAESFKREFFGPPREKKEKAKKPSRTELMKIRENRRATVNLAKGDVFYCFKNFKKAHEMVMW